MKLFSLCRLNFTQTYLWWLLVICCFQLFPVLVFVAINRWCHLKLDFQEGNRFISMSFLGDHFCGCKIFSRVNFQFNHLSSVFFTFGSFPFNLFYKWICPKLLVQICLLCCAYCVLNLTVFEVCIPLTCWVISCW